MRLINDEQTLVGAKTQWGREIPVYDDSWGKLYILRDSMGIMGIVRAQTWEDAYEICEDEFFPEASETIAELDVEYPNWPDDCCWQEEYGFRPNGPNVADKHKHGIYVKDLNGDYLDVLTPTLAEKLEITLTIECENEECLV